MNSDAYYAVSGAEMDLVYDNISDELKLQTTAASCVRVLWLLIVRHSSYAHSNDCRDFQSVYNTCSKHHELKNLASTQIY